VPRRRTVPRRRVSRRPAVRLGLGPVHTLQEGGEAHMQPIIIDHRSWHYRTRCLKAALIMLLAIVIVVVILSPLIDLIIWATVCLKLGALQWEILRDT